MWAEQMPEVDVVRPSGCRHCGAASRPPGRGLGLHGHGARVRQVRGPVGPTEGATTTLLRVRRYRCTSCSRTQTCGPAELLTGFLYSASAIAFALALFGVVGATRAEVRRRISTWQLFGPSSAARWETLTRWCRRARAGTLFLCIRPAPPVWTLRRVAGRAATSVAAHAAPSPEPPSLAVLAFTGAARAR